jgi:hypothetical protein
MRCAGAAIRLRIGIAIPASQKCWKVGEMAEAERVTIHDALTRAVQHDFGDDVRVTAFVAAVEVVSLTDGAQSVVTLVDDTSPWWHLAGVLLAATINDDDESVNDD